ncbi:DctP family TRAP transporter solute-binding subunit [Treponema sp. OMZ 840]|uniref:C4-dicarboxylate TRAP transporter substrate-binding protein n=1 Tax=Treponema sp. OMZ 840 TaxID=244313 RepID=UPI003D8CE33C
MKKFVVVLSVLALALGIGFANGSQEAKAGKPVVIQIGFENAMYEPVGQAVQKWKELLEQESKGTMKLEIYPDSQLGSKNKLIDSMLLGEPVITIAEGSFYAEYGVPDFGILVSPFLFDNWDQCWKLIDSPWYAEQCKKLETKGLKILTSNWVYGERHTLTTKPVNKVEDFKGLKIRVPNNKIQTIGMNVLGCTATGMSLGDVYQALQTKTIDGAENPLSTLYGRKLHEVAKYLVLDGHVKMLVSWLTSNQFFKSLTPEQQQLLISTGNKAGLYNNECQASADKEYLDKMVAEGCTVKYLSPQELAAFKAKAQSFYDHGKEFNWSEGLYQKVLKAME